MVTTEFQDFISSCAFSLYQPMMNFIKFSNQFCHIFSLQQPIYSPCQILRSRIVLDQFRYKHSVRENIRQGEPP